MHLGTVAEGLEAEDLNFFKLEQGSIPLYGWAFWTGFVIWVDRSTSH
jgi:hypothetical protein